MCVCRKSELLQVYAQCQCGRRDDEVNVGALERGRSAENARCHVKGRRRLALHVDSI